MNCKICNTKTNLLFQLPILSNKYLIHYFQCPTCQFIQTEKPYWLDEAYSDAAITALDVGAVTRNLELSNLCERVLKNIFPDYKAYFFLDYGGATGMFTRLMRDKGFQFYHSDKYAQNVYAKKFELEDITDKSKIAAVTSFEVFEHLEFPMETIQEMFKYANTIVFSTYLQPKNLENWWYFTLETGQHIALFHKNTFLKISEILGVRFFTNGTNYHILTKENWDKQVESYLKPPFYQKMWYKLFPQTSNSLIQKDYQQIKDSLNG
jgi:Methyltransferase domain